MPALIHARVWHRPPHRCVDGKTLLIVFHFRICGKAYCCCVITFLARCAFARNSTCIIFLDRAPVGASHHISIVLLHRCCHVIFTPLGDRGGGRRRPGVLLVTGDTSCGGPISVCNSLLSDLGTSGRWFHELSPSQRAQSLGQKKTRSPSRRKLRTAIVRRPGEHGWIELTARATMGSDGALLENLAVLQEAHDRAEEIRNEIATLKGKTV